MTGTETCEVTLMEQDVIGHLIDVERSAFDLMMDAQNEADKRKTAAREEAEQKFRSAYEAIVAELETGLDKQKRDCDASRDTEYAELQARLEAIEQDRGAFSGYLDSLFPGA